MTRSEYLEFYVRSTARARPGAGDSTSVQLSEDAFYYRSRPARTNGNCTSGDTVVPGVSACSTRKRAWPKREIWGPDKDALGLWDAACARQSRAAVTLLRDPSANCARNNGEPDTEDLNGNGIPDSNDGRISALSFRSTISRTRTWCATR